MRQHLITIKIIDDETGSELWTDEVDLSAVLAFKGEGFLFKSDLEAEKMEKEVIVDEDKDKNTEVKRSENLDDDETQVNPEQNEDTTVEPDHAAEGEEEETNYEVDEIEE